MTVVFGGKFSLGVHMNQIDVTPADNSGGLYIRVVGMQKIDPPPVTIRADQLYDAVMGLYLEEARRQGWKE